MNERPSNLERGTFLEFSRKRDSEITLQDFREALSSFGLTDDKAAVDKLFSLYDWRQARQVAFQVSHSRRGVDRVASAVDAEA